jgi:hypothetical protein
MPGSRSIDPIRPALQGQCRVITGSSQGIILKRLYNQLLPAMRVVADFNPVQSGHARRRLTPYRLLLIVPLRGPTSLTEHCSASRAFLSALVEPNGAVVYAARHAPVSLHVSTFATLTATALVRRPRPTPRCRLLGRLHPRFILIHVLIRSPQDAHLGLAV